MKSTKYDRITSSGKSVSPYIENNLLGNWQEATQMHYQVSTAVHQRMLEWGAEAVLVRDVNLTAADFVDKELVISMGGDGTYLRVQGYIRGDIPIIGINTDPKRSVGFLCSEKVYVEDLEKNIDALLDKINKGAF